MNIRVKPQLIPRSRISRSKHIKFKERPLKRRKTAGEISPAIHGEPLKRDSGLYPREIMDLTPDEAQILM